MRKRNKYERYIVGIAGLLLAAMILPQVVLHIQDEYQLGRTQKKTKAALNISQAEVVYETDTYERMCHLVNMNLEEAAVASLDEDTKDEEAWNSRFSELFEQDWFGAFHYCTDYAYDTLFSLCGASDIQNCRKYIVYNDDGTEGIALMMWYLEIYEQVSGYYLQMLVDSETNTVYYVKITANPQAEAYKAKEIKDSSQAMAISETYDVEYFYASADHFLKQREFYQEYYESDQTLTADDNVIHLGYGELSLPFYFQVSRNIGGLPESCMGFDAVKKLVPELADE